MMSLEKPSIETAPAAAPPLQVIALAGELCLEEVPGLRARIDGAVGDGAPDLVLDLAACTLLTAAALGVIVGAEARLAALGGSLRLRDPQPLAARILAVTGLDRLL
jgi:anti-sigma B factor antagonist